MWYNTSGCGWLCCDQSSFFARTPHFSSSTVYILHFLVILQCLVALFCRNTENLSTVTRVNGYFCLDTKLCSKVFVVLMFCLAKFFT